MFVFLLMRRVHNYNYAYVASIKKQTPHSWATMIYIYIMMTACAAAYWTTYAQTKIARQECQSALPSPGFYPEILGFF